MHANWGGTEIFEALASVYKSPLSAGEFLHGLFVSSTSIVLRLVVHSSAPGTTPRCLLVCSAIHNGHHGG